MLALYMYIESRRPVNDVIITCIYISLKSCSTRGYVIITSLTEDAGEVAEGVQTGVALCVHDGQSMISTNCQSVETTNIQLY